MSGETINRSFEDDPDKIRRHLALSVGKLWPMGMPDTYFIVDFDTEIHIDTETATLYANPN